MAKINNPGKLFKTLLKTTSKDATRPILGCAYLAENGDAVSTDTYRLTVVHDAWSGGANISIPNEVVRGLAKAKAAIKTAELTVSDDGGFVKATLSDGTEFGDELPNGKFPNYLQLFEGLKDNTTAYVKTKEALAVIREHVKCKREVRVDVCRDNVRIYGYGEERLPEWGCEKAAEGKENIATFNGAYLRDALTVCGDTAELHIDSWERPMIVKSAEHDVEVLVMPINRPTSTAKSTTKKPERKPERKPEPKPELKPKSHPYKGRRFYIFGEVGEPIEYTTKGGSKFTFRIGHEYLYRANGKSGECMFLGYDTAKDRPCFAEVTDDGDFWYTWPGDKRTLEYMVNHTNGEPSYHIDKDAIERKKFAEKFAEKCEEKTGIKLDVKPIPGGGFAASVAKAEPKKEGTDMELKKRIEELEAELAKRNAELEEVWKENESLKRAPKPEPEPEPKVEAADMPTAVTLETMQAWCEGKNLLATQKRAGTCIWVEGESKPYANELKEMGFRFAKKRKSWYFTPAE